MSIYPEISVRTVLDSLDIESVLKLIDYRTDTIQVMESCVKCFCPIHKESVFRTLIIDRNTNKFTCSYSMCPGRNGGDLIELTALSQKLDYDEGLRLLVEHFDMPVELPPPAEYIERTLEIAENYLELSVLDEAESEFLKISRVQPDHPTVVEGLAEIYRQRGDKTKLREKLGRLFELQYADQQHERALATAGELLETEPQNPELLEKMAECQLGLGHEKEALDQLMQVAAQYEEKNDFKAALIVYRRIRDLELSWIDVTPHLINGLVTMGEPDEAVELAQVQARNCSSHCLYDQALSMYMTALDIDETRSDLRREMIDTAVAAGLNDYQLADCIGHIDYYIQKESPADAAEIIDRIKTKRPNQPQVMEKEIQVFQKQGREDLAAQRELELIDELVSHDQVVEALKRTEQLARGNGKSSDVLSRLAQTAYSLGNVQLAISLLLKKVEIESKENHLDEVLATYDQLFEMSPQQPEFLIAPIQLLLEVDQSDQAVLYSEKLINYYAEREEWLPLSDALVQGLSLAPDRREWKEQLARVYTLLGHPEQACEYYLDVARGMLNRKDWPHARDIVNQVRRWDPRHLQATELLGEIYLGMGQRQQAFEEFRTLVVSHIENQNVDAAKGLVDRMRSIKSDPIEALELEVELYKSAGDTKLLVETMRRLAEEYARRKAYSRAVECALGVLDFFPEDIPAIKSLIEIFEASYKTENALDMKLRLSEIYRQREDFGNEIAIYRELMRDDPNDWRARRKLIEAMIRTHRFEEAVPAAIKFLDQFGHGKQLAEAIDVANSVLAYDADNIALQQRLTELYKRQGQHEDWATQATQLINCYSRRNMHAEVTQIYEDLVQAQPDNINFRVNLIAAYVELNKLDKARQQHLELARHYLSRNNHEDAEATLRQALELSPEDEAILTQLAELYEKESLAEKRTGILEKIADIHLKKGKKQDALSVLKEILAFNPDNGEVERKINELSVTLTAADSQIRRRHELSQSLLDEGKVDDAIDQLREAVDLKPDDTCVRRRLVRVLVDHEQGGNAVDELWTIVNQHNANEQYNDVLRSLNEILRLDPRNAAARKMKAETYAKMGDEKMALEEFMKISSESDAPSTNTPLTDTDSAEEDYSPFEPMPIMSDYTFEEFVVGDNSNFAFATCQSAAKAPAKHYNPVFIWSDVGLGKTHLINAIANYISEHQPQLRLHYTSAEQFTGQLIDAISQNRLAAFRNYYKKADVLMVDDIQFLAGKEKAQEEFFHVFNFLFQAKKQIAITCDRPPKDIAHLEKRLKSRFGAGVILDIQAPDLETRMAILKKEADAYETEIDNAITQQLSERISTNVRALKGAFNQMMALHEMSGEPLDDALIERVLSQIHETV